MLRHRRLLLICRLPPSLEILMVRENLVATGKVHFCLLTHFAMLLSWISTRLQEYCQPWSKEEQSARINVELLVVDRETWAQLPSWPPVSLSTFFYRSKASLGTCNQAPDSKWRRWQWGSCQQTMASCLIPDNNFGKATPSLLHVTQHEHWCDVADI
jgi:hypothetical protein